MEHSTDAARYMSGPHTSRSAPDTSHRAAERVTHKLPAVRVRILNWAATLAHGGFIDEEMYQHFPRIPVNTLRPRRSELADENWLIDSGGRIKNAVGNECVVWIHRDFADNPPPIVERPGPREKWSAQQERRSVIELIHKHHAASRDLAVRGALLELAGQFAAGSHRL